MRVASVFAMGDAMRPADMPAEEAAAPAPPRKRRVKPIVKKKVAPKRPALRKRAPKPPRARARTATIDPIVTRRFRVLNELIAQLARIKAELKATFEASPA